MMAEIELLKIHIEQYHKTLFSKKGIQSNNLLPFITYSKRPAIKFALKQLF